MPNLDRPKHCRGHGAAVPDAEWNYHTLLCNSCTSRLATLYGIPKADVGAVDTVKKNLVAYFRDIPGADKLPEREMVRMLLMRLGVQVENPTDRELRGARYLENRKKEAT